MSATAKTYTEGAYGLLQSVDFREDSPEVIQATATVAVGYALLAVVEGLEELRQTVRRPSMRGFG